MIWCMLFVSLPFSVYGIDLSRLYGHLRPPVQKRSGRFSPFIHYYYFLLLMSHAGKCINNDERRKSIFIVHVPCLFMIPMAWYRVIDTMNYSNAHYDGHALRKWLYPQTYQSTNIPEQLLVNIISMRSGYWLDISRRRHYFALMDTLYPIQFRVKLDWFPFRPLRTRPTTQNQRLKKDCQSFCVAAPRNKWIGWAHAFHT